MTLHLTKRTHHKVDWEHCTPKILSDKYRKGM
nr:MAG TPA: hypothetical protein [Caudoviricetes sp.]